MPILKEGVYFRPEAARCRVVELANLRGQSYAADCFLRCCDAIKALQTITQIAALLESNSIAGFLDPNQEGAMAIAGHVLDARTKTANYFGFMANANGTSAIVEAVQEYLASWSKERIANIQKIDAGWAPFDVSQRPLQVNGALDVRCIRDAIHCHCMALREAGVALTPELVELDEFFFVASEMIENFGQAALHARTPAIPSHRDVFVNW